MTTRYKVIEVGQQFDIINCFGHMKDVMGGGGALWRTYCALVGPCRSVFTTPARRAVSGAREYAEDGGFSPNVESMRACRQAMILDQDDELIASVVNSWEFYNMSNFRDLALHYQEHQLTLPEIRGIIKKLGLEFIGFALDDLSNARIQPPSGVAITYGCTNQTEPRLCQVTESSWLSPQVQGVY